MNKRNLRKGFGSFAVALIVMIILLIAAVAWYYEIHKVRAPVIAITTQTSSISTMASCDQSELQGKNSVPVLEGGLADQTQSEADAIFRTLISMGVLTSNDGEPLEYDADGQTYLVIQTSTGVQAFQASNKEQLYRATTTDLLNGTATLVPLTSVVGSLKSIYPEGYVTGTLLYTADGVSPPYALQAINPETGQSLWSFSTSVALQNVAISGDGIFVDLLTQADNGFAKLDPLTGRVLWQSSVGNLPVIFDDGRFVYTTEDGLSDTTSTIYQLSDETGEIIKRFPLPFDQKDGISLPYFVNGIDECGGNVYLWRWVDSDGGDNSVEMEDYSRLDTLTGNITELGVACNGNCKL